jgi:AraC-like DNA-binding protein
MALTYSVDLVDENGKELLTYGTEDFPIAFFDDDLTKIAVPNHWHDELEIVVITEGKVIVRIAGREFLLAAGDGYFANSAVLHAAELKTTAGHQHAMVFNPAVISAPGSLAWKAYLEPLLGDPQLPFVRLSASVPWQKEILNCFEKAWDLGAYDKEDYPVQVPYLLGKVFAALTGHADLVKSELHYTTKYQRDELRIKKALLFIETNYGNAITIEDIADSAGVSVSSCLRLFRSIIGSTPVSYLVKFRLQKAAEEFQRKSGRTIAETAYLCGFTDASYFNRCFRKEYGMTPSEFIAEHKLS